MRLEQIEQVLQIAEQKSINKAAKSLYVSQPMLSQSIKSLENEIGKQLFIRSGSGVELTPFGHVFADQAANVIREFDSLKQLCRQNLGQIRRFRVASYPLDTSRSAYIKLLGKYIGEINDFGFSEGTSMNVIKQVAAGEADLGIDMVSALEARKMASILPSYNLKSEFLATCPLCVVVGLGSKFLDRIEISKAELANATLIYFGDGWDAFETEFSEFGLRHDTPGKHASSSNECRELLDTGNYYCLLSLARAKEFQAFAPNTKAIKVTDVNAAYRVQYIYKPTQTLSDTALEYLDALRLELLQEGQN